MELPHGYMAYQQLPKTILRHSWDMASWAMKSKIHNQHKKLTHISKKNWFFELLCVCVKLAIHVQWRQVHSLIVGKIISSSRLIQIQGSSWCTCSLSCFACSVKLCFCWPNLKIHILYLTISNASTRGFFSVILICSNSKIVWRTEIPQMNKKA